MPRTPLCRPFRLPAFPIVVALVLFIALLVAPTYASVELTLDNSFIEKYKDRATIEVTLTVDKAHQKPNPPSKDGDLHIAGRAAEVGLPVVAEIMNAKYREDAVAAIHHVEGTGKAIPLAGAWRLWAEHGGDSTQTQGDPLAAFDTSNPDHVFEIHPVTKVGDLAVSDTFKPISGFKYKKAEEAFFRYENIPCEIKCGSKTTTILTGMAGYNYVDFVMQLLEDPKHLVEDGLTMMASVLDQDGELLVRKRRMVFVKGTAPYESAKALKAGDELHVLGIPRMNLYLVSWRCEHASEKPEVLRWTLPYEMIVVAVLKK